MKFSFSTLSRDEKYLFISTFLHAIGVEAAYFVGITGYAAYGLHASATTIAIIMGALTVMQMIGSAVAGALIDHFGPRSTIIGSSVGLVVITLGVQGIGTNLNLFILFAGLAGFFFALSRTSYNSFAPYIAKGRDELKRVNSFVMVAAYSAAIIGPAFGGVIVGHFQTLRVFIFCAATVSFALLFALKTKEYFKPEKDNSDSAPSGWRKSVEGIRLVFTVESLRFYMLIGVLLWFSFGAFDALESLYYKDVVGVSVAWLGWVNTIIGIGLVLGVFILAKLPSRYISAVFLVAMVGIEGVGSLLYVGTRSIWVVMIGGFLLGVAFGIAEPLMRTLIQADAPLASVGRVQGAIQVFRIGLTLIPLAIAPALSKIIGVQAVLIGASSLTLLLAALVYSEGKRVDSLWGTKRTIDHIDPFDEAEETHVHERIPGRLDD